MVFLHHGGQGLQLEPGVPGWTSGVFHTSDSQGLGPAPPVLCQSSFLSPYLVSIFSFPFFPCGAPPSLFEILSLLFACLESLPDKWL